MHAEIAVAALEAGKHVLVEKPLANTLAEAEAISACMPIKGTGPLGTYSRTVAPGRFSISPT